MGSCVLSDAGVGDYYEDVDGYVRNQLTEMQITRPDLLREAAQTLHGIPDYNDGDASDTVNRIVGTYFSDSGSPARIPQVRMYYTICCTGNCIPALHYAWESIVRCHDGFAKVNLLLNRASPWLDIDSYLHRSGPFLVQPQSDGLYDDLQGQHLGRYYATGGRGGLPTLPARSGA